jgi:hypothetical protein
MRKWMWCGTAVMLMAVAGLYFACTKAAQNSHSWLGTVVTAIAGAPIKGQGVREAALAPAPVPLPGPVGQEGVPPPAPLPHPHEIEAVEPIVIDAPLTVPVDFPPALPPEINEAIAELSLEENETVVPFMPPALDDFDAPTRRMPYADEDLDLYELIPAPSLYEPTIEEEEFAIEIRLP